MNVLTYDQDYVLPYGKYEGLSLKKLVEHDPGYLRWASHNLEGEVSAKCDEAWPHATDEYMDDDGEWWLPSQAVELTVCAHCGDAIEAGRRLLDSSDGRRIHLECWDLHDGFTRAMNED